MRKSKFYFHWKKKLPVLILLFYFFFPFQIPIIPCLSYIHTYKHTATNALQSNCENVNVFGLQLRCFCKEIKGVLDDRSENIIYRLFNVRTCVVVPKSKTDPSNYVLREIIQYKDDFPVPRVIRNLRTVDIDESTNQEYIKFYARRIEFLNSHSISIRDELIKYRDHTKKNKVYKPISQPSCIDLTQNDDSDNEPKPSTSGLATIRSPKISKYSDSDSSSDTLEYPYPLNSKSLSLSPIENESNLTPYLQQFEDNELNISSQQTSDDNISLPDINRINEAMEIQSDPVPQGEFQPEAVLQPNVPDFNILMETENMDSNPIPYIIYMPKLIH